MIVQVAQVSPPKGYAVTYRGTVPLFWTCAGTVTMLMVKQDERSNKHRERVETLNQFADMNDVPNGLHKAMKVRGSSVHPLRSYYKVLV